MFNEIKRNGATKGPLLAVFGSDACLEGKFTIGESIQIECEIAGEINVEGKLVIGEKGIVRATVNTVDAIIRGQYQGDMVATGDVEITETGRVTGPLERELRASATARTMVYACGPTPMMRAVSDLAEHYGCRSEVSLEQVMGCGLGGCYSCVVPLREGDGPPRFVRSCLDGPVFAGNDISWSHLE